MQQQPRSKKAPYISTGYFDEEKLLGFLAGLNNARDKNYKDFRFCLKDEYEKKLPNSFIYHDDITVDEIITILDAKEKTSAVWSLDRYKRVLLNDNKLTWWRRILLWLAK